ncbi:MAG: AMIN domain-containing protein [Gemmatimonadaceae bacterium]
MRRVWSLAALGALALGASTLPANAAYIESGDAARQASRTVRRTASPVTAVSIVSAAGRAEVVITVDGPVDVHDFTVGNPDRIVLDLSVARLQRGGQSYDGVVRAGIANVRMAQFRPDVVRIVLDLNERREYTVARGEREVRIAIASDEQFAAWSSSGAVPRAAMRPAVEQPAPNVERARDSLAAAALDSSVAEPPPAPAAVVTPVAQLQQRSQARRITVTYQDADISAVLAAFAGFSGRTIVVGKDVKGTVTAEIKDQPWDIALAAILQSQGLAAIEDSSGIITVDSYQNILTKQASEPLTTQIVKMNYARAASLAEVVKGLLSKDCPQGALPTATTGAGGQLQITAGTPVCITRGGVAVDTATNSLLITEVTSRLPSLMSYVRELDVRTPQVALNAKVLSLNRTMIEQLGVSYDFGSRGTFFNTLLPRIPEGETRPSQFESQVTVDGQSFAGVGNARRKFGGSAALSLLFSTAIGGFSLSSFLDALSEQQLSEIQAEPSIVTLDNREARMFVGQETPVRVIDAGAAGQVGVPARANVQFKEAGILLRVTPHITNNRQVQMTLEAEQSDLSVIGGELGFIINKRNARSQVLVNNGETAVIGGLTQTQKSKIKSGIPLLMQLPLVGRFFSQTDEREEKHDLMIIITPTIIDEGQPVRPRGLEPR